MINHNKNNGFTLIEVLIAMLVLAIGLLGMAGLQATSLRNNQSAYNRSQATQLAYDISDRMRANTLVAANYVSTFMAVADATVKVNCLSTTGCSAADMAENDLFELKTALTTALPNGVASIGVDTITPNPNLYTITINWDDNRDGVINADDPNFQVSFEL